MRRGLLIYNPAAGGRITPARMHRVIARAARRGVALEERPTSGPGDATRIVAASIASNPDVIVVAGGDGTVAEAAAALIGTMIPLAILPYGTANVLAREYGAGAWARYAERCIPSRKTRALTAWRAEGRVCFMWMGVGLDARMMKGANSLLKRRLGRLGIAVTAVRDFWHYDFPALSVEGIDGNGGAFAHSATYVVACNIRRYGGEVLLAPEADPEDELVDLVIFTGRTRGALARLLFHLATRRSARPEVKDVVRVRARSVMVRAVGEAPVEVQVDGEVAGTTPAGVGPVVGRVRIVVPE